MRQGAKPQGTGRSEPPAQPLAARRLVRVLQFRIAFLLCMLVAGLLGARAETPVPYLSGRVNDVAGILSTSTIERLDAILKAHEDSTSNQVVVLTIPALEGGETIEQFSIRVVDTWKLGQKGKDNGVLLLVSRDDHKVRIEVGSGLEGALPDITCGIIIRHEIIPRFKAEDYDGGVTAGISAILSSIRGEYHADEVEASNGLGVLGTIFFIALFLVTVGTFTLIGITAPGCLGWFLYLFLVPFWAAFPMVIFGSTVGMTLFVGYFVLFPIARILLPKTSWGARLKKSAAASHGGSGSSGWISWGSSSSGSSSSSSSSFSGGGGGFSGGGSSGSW